MTAMIASLLGFGPIVHAICFVAALIAVIAIVKKHAPIRTHGKIVEESSQELPPPSKHDISEKH